MDFWHWAALEADGDDRRLVENDAAATHVDQRIRRAEVDREIVGKILAEETEHLELRCLGCGRENFYDTL
jgi:hypothetical protein